MHSNYVNISILSLPPAPPLKTTISATPIVNSGLKNRMLYDDTPSQTEPLPPANLFPKDYSPNVTCEQAIKELKLKHETTILNWCVKRSHSLHTSPPTTTQTKLTFDEILSIVAYTFDIGLSKPREENLYFQLNSVLRARSSNELAKWRDYIFYLLCALEKVPKYSGIVTRGIDLTIPTEKYKASNQIVWNAFSSCSKQEKVAKNFLSDTGSLFVLDIENGCLISDYSALPNEDEVLILPNSEWKVNLTFLDSKPPMFHMKQTATTQTLWDLKKDVPDIDIRVTCSLHSGYYLDDFCLTCQRRICPSMVFLWFFCSYF